MQKVKPPNRRFFYYSMNVERNSWTIKGQIISGAAIETRNQIDAGIVGQEFQVIDGHLAKPYNICLQKPVSGRFQHSAVRIRAIGDREYEVGDQDSPLYTKLENQWVRRRGRAVRLGYIIKTFIECAYQR